MNTYRGKKVNGCSGTHPSGKKRPNGRRLRVGEYQAATRSALAAVPDTAAQRQYVNGLVRSRYFEDWPEALDFRQQVSKGVAHCGPLREDPLRFISQGAYYFVYDQRINSPLSYEEFLEIEPTI
jgi:hypothetical protein